ncbi:MAG: hypothetical protein M3285_14075 [Actinomycetota bacterium]|nr:hypothetical protein [Actinomycetota bacterium]
MRRLAIFFSLALLAGLVVTARAGTLQTLPAGSSCATGSLSEAAEEVFGAGTEVVARQNIAGLDGALVLEPRIAPGTRARLLRVGDSWCEASSSFNLAWASAGRTFDDAAARAYAQLAPAPYFDEVTVTSLDTAVAGTYTLTTHALTNGVDARWSITTDDTGLVSAKWTAIAFAQQPFEAQFEGLTALPGGHETYTRTANGLLAADRGLPTPESARKAAPPSLAEYKSPDGFVISVSVGDSHVALDPGMDTGARKADIVRETMRAIKINYEDFYSWGLRKGWGAPEPVSGPNRGYVYINDALSLYCLACVQIANHFQIHLISEVETVLAAFGYTYPNSVKAYQSLIGHEMFHNFQNRYNKPGQFANTDGRGVTTAYSEGTARAQETMHKYSDVSYQKNSLIYANDANGCNGFEGSNFDATMANGIFNRGYTACFFWLSWIAAEGTDGLKQVVAHAYPKVSPETNGSIEGVQALERASKLSVAKQAARFAGAAITGRGYRLGGFDWAKMLDRWRPLGLGAKGSASASLAPSGMLARQLRSAAKVKLSKASDAELFVVTDTGSKTVTKVVKGQSICLQPKKGQDMWVGAVQATEESSMAEIRASKPTCR